MHSKLNWRVTRNVNNLDAEVITLILVLYDNANDKLMFYHIWKI